MALKPSGTNSSIDSDYQSQNDDSSTSTVNTSTVTRRSFESTNQSFTEDVNLNYIQRYKTISIYLFSHYK